MIVILKMFFVIARAQHSYEYDLLLSIVADIFISVALKVAQDPPSTSILAPLPDSAALKGYHTMPSNGFGTYASVFNCQLEFMPLRLTSPQSLYHQP